MTKNKRISTTKGTARTKRIPAPVNVVAKPIIQHSKLDDLLIDPVKVDKPVTNVASANSLDNATITPNTTIEINGDVDSINTPIQVKDESHTGRSGRGIVIGLIGGSVIGYVAYNGLKTVFTDKGYDQDKANQYAMISAGVCALLTFGILYNLTKKVA